VAILYPSFEPRNGELVISKLGEAAGGDVMFKVFHSREAGKRVVLTSYNPTFPPLEYMRDEFQWIYPVASVVKHFRR
jgi:phage repressor protein C with HTH and peptisase S24 domain